MAKGRGGGSTLLLGGPSYGNAPPSGGSQPVVSTPAAPAPASGWLQGPPRPPGQGYYNGNTASQASIAAAAAQAAQAASGGGAAGGVHHAPVAPYLTPSQQQALDDMIARTNQSIIDSDYQYSKTAANTYEQAGHSATDQTGLMYQQMIKDRASQNDNLIARGLGMSSIRDGQLADIEATSAARRTSLLNALALDASHNALTKANLQGALSAYEGSANAQRVENAQAITPVPDQAPGQQNTGYGQGQQGVQSQPANQGSVNVPAPTNPTGTQLVVGTSIPGGTPSYATGNIPYNNGGLIIGTPTRGG